MYTHLILGGGVVVHAKRKMARLSRLLARGYHGLAAPERVVVMHKTSRLEWERRRRRIPGTELASRVRS